MMIPPSPLRFAYALLALPVALLAGVSARAADADSTAAVEAYIGGHYYEIEFFVFERLDVMDFNSGETLALDRVRALPNRIRTQRLEPGALWTDPIDGPTRACLTYPTITYDWVPDDQAAIVEPVASRPVPEIHPRLEPDPLLDFLARVAEFERTLEDRADRWQPADTFTLNREASRVARSGIGRVLFHGRWLQDLPDRESPDPILIRAGERLQVPWQVQELVGSVGVTLGRYLHFQAELFLHGPGFGLLPTGAALDADGKAELQVRPLPGPRYMVLSESRRMRSGELHYLDHPKLGVIVRIDPVVLPAELIEAYEAFQESL